MFAHWLLGQLWVTRIGYLNSTVAVVVIANEKKSARQTWSCDETVGLNGLAIELSGDDAHGKDMLNKRLIDMAMKMMESY